MFAVVIEVLMEEVVDKEVAKVVEQVKRKLTSVGQQKLSWRWSWIWCWMRLTCIDAKVSYAVGKKDEGRCGC